MAYNATNPNGQATSANSAPVVLASDQSAITVKQSDISSNGALSAASTYVTVSNLQGVATATVQVSGTWVGTLTPQASLDGTNYIALNATGLINVNTGAYSATIASASQGMWQSDIAGFNFFRVGMTSYTSGTATITIKTTNATGAVAIDNPLPAGSNTLGAVNINTATFGLNPTASSTALTAYSNQALTATTQLVGAAGNRRLFEYDFYNPNSSGVWVQLFNSATAAGVTLGTTTPLRTVYVPPTSGRDWSSPWSVGYGSGLVVACTTTNTGSTAPTSAIQAYIGYV